MIKAPELAQGSSASTGTSEIIPPHFSFLALKGGGSKGLIHLGVMMLLDRLGLLDEIAMIGGTSAGGIGALLISSGWSADKIRQELDALDLYDLIYQEYTVTAPYRLYMGLGLHKGHKIHEWFQQIIKMVTGNENTTFLEWHEIVASKITAEGKYPMKDICLEAHNTSTGLNEVFSHVSEHKHVPIADALRATMAYTGFFTPWDIDGHLYADGGLQADCPVRLFECTEGAPNPNMLAVWMDEPDRLHYLLNKTPLKVQTPKNLSEFLYANIVGMYNLQLKLLAHSPYKDKFMLCDTVGVDTFDFSNTPENQQKLIQSGFYGALRYFLLAYPDFTKQFIPPDLIAHIEALDHPVSVATFEKTPMMTSVSGVGPSAASTSASVGEIEADEEEPWVVLLPLFEAMKISTTSSDSTSKMDKDKTDVSKNASEQKNEAPKKSWWYPF
tara:strand:- start:48754 stop:50079 length:1326 start_codon:yes stop_codon:yes gene_type:complete